MGNYADHIRRVTEYLSQGHDYIRQLTYTGGRSPVIILYTDEQIEDIKTYCCSGKTVLGFDKTCNVADMHVTVSCFKQLSIIRTETRDNPIFIGPLFIHDYSDAEGYSIFLVLCVLC